MVVAEGPIGGVLKDDRSELDAAQIGQGPHHRIGDVNQRRSETGGRRGGVIFPESRHCQPFYTPEPSLPLRHHRGDALSSLLLCPSALYSWYCYIHIGKVADFSAQRRLPCCS
jgi:hypothetical protein